MQLALYMTAIRVRDLDCAFPFYDTLLGQTGELVSPGRHYYYLGGVALALREPYAHDLELLPNPDWIYVATDNLELAFENAQKVGATITEPIKTHPWGARSFYLRDPDGNGLCFTDETTLNDDGKVMSPLLPTMVTPTRHYRCCDNGGGPARCVQR